MWEQLMGMFGGGMGAGAAMDPGAQAGIFGRIAEIAPEWSPFPLLDAMNQGGPQQPMGAPQANGQWNWMNPQGAAGPLNPGVMQSGPMAGVTPPALPTPPATAAAAPLSPQQMAMLQAMSPKPPDPNQVRFAPAVSPSGGGRSVAMSPLTLPQGGAAGVPGLAQILGRR